MVEVGDLLAQVVVLQQHRSAAAGFEGMVGLAQSCTGRGGQMGALLSAVALLGIDLLAAVGAHGGAGRGAQCRADRKSTRLNSSHVAISYAVFCLKTKM